MFRRHQHVNIIHPAKTIMQPLLKNGQSSCCQSFDFPRKWVGPSVYTRQAASYEGQPRFDMDLTVFHLISLFFSLISLAGCTCGPIVLSIWKQCWNKCCEVSGLLRFVFISPSWRKNKNKTKQLCGLILLVAWNGHPILPPVSFWLTITSDRSRGDGSVNCQFI